MLPGKRVYEMAKYDYMKIQKKLERALDPDRYQHTLGVMFTATSLAMRHEVDLDQAQIAGLLHDCAKCIPNAKKLKICEDKKVPITDFEKKHPYLIHAKLGAYVADATYGVKDPEVLSAIACHTTGKPGMTDLEKIIYIADYIEPMRDKAPNLAKLRKLAFKNLDECVYRIMKDTLDYLKDDPKDIDETTREAYLYYKEIHKEKKKQKEETNNE